MNVLPHSHNQGVAETWGARSKSKNNIDLSRFHTTLPEQVASSFATYRNHSSMVEEDLNDNDIICGRGKGWYNCPGNRTFRALCREHVRSYFEARNKMDKSIVIDRILEEIRSRQGRFVKLHSEGCWYELGDEQAREKVGHTLREAFTSSLASHKRNAHMGVFHRKQTDLLAQQRILFERMVHPKPKSRLTRSV